MYIERLHIQDFRCFADTEFTLNYPGRKYPRGKKAPKLDNVNLFLGDNGTGKTSAFRAAVIAVLSPILNNSGFVTEYSVRRQMAGATTEVKPASLRAKTVFVPPNRLLNHPDYLGFVGEISSRITVVGDTESIHLDPLAEESDDHFRALFTAKSPEIFLAAYAANRRTARPEGYSEGNRTARYQRVAGIFEDHVGLMPFRQGQLELVNLDHIDEADEILDKLLPEEVQTWDANFISRLTPLPFSALSDGYRTFIGWVWDLLVQIARVTPSGTPLYSMSGIVIVDEIDLFLHPDWQRTVIARIATTFPNLQFLFSTHSPLVAGSVESSNIYVLEDDPDNEGASVVKQYTEHIQGLSADQILTGSYFGLRTTRAQPLVDDLNDLLAKAVGSDDPKIAIEYLTRLNLGSERDEADRNADQKKLTATSS